jgi:hypothetical protein
MLIYQRVPASKHGLPENPPFMDDFPSEKSLHLVQQFSQLAMFDDRVILR